MQPTFSAQDEYFMQIALDLAKKGIFTTTPNPAVGCVLVKNGEIVGRGFHFKAGQPHAEVMALRDAGDRAKGATAYVTLEPCSHFGRTPPCAQGLIEAGIRNVIVAMKDPNPQVAGKGLAMLQAAGIESAVGLLQEKAELLNKGFLTRMRTQKPFVILKMAISLDGRTAMANGESKWISGEQARQDVQQERAKVSAILSTAKTVLADDPLLNLRWEQFPSELQQNYKVEEVRQPVRIILDRQHLVTPRHKLFQFQSPVWLVGDKERDISAFPDYCQYIKLFPSNEHSYLENLLIELAKRQINSLWLEAGETLAGAFIEENLVNELIIYMAPKLLGNEARGFCHLPHLNRLADAPKWQLLSLAQIGEDIKLNYQRHIL
ncbi:bifunctional diaminohydroxyphosphoribosylaminopyrimidine deaminase/5-amino-6-(5-phosphoribosylamino)uracil reductase RibD [Histophilus somni]|uniref:bifunctional diaminohydroxyphosphoribosylaminopyrimidine deaminase/5-amino-6-(5-phosphoribosylamino)uracil reductase RibD n=1 Tax=Histophilus somni TaxID=731 RepID=UPI00201EB83A|nr:bifunctional diaminohydroxyphosphoribosylaminopyrimidine deaminase/5-amino-6-(5-phosphoribosylamino)uracil reductase RibD [Histophilus somni]